MKGTRWKLGLLLMMSVVMSFGIWGCGKKQEAQTRKISIKTLQETMLQADTTLPEMEITGSEEEDGELNFTALCDFEYKDVESYFYAFAKDGTPEEIAVIGLQDSNDAAMCMNSLKKHLENRKGTLQEYSPESVDLVENAIITRKGNYVTLIVSEKNGLVQEAFKEALK